MVCLGKMGLLKVRGFGVEMDLRYGSWNCFGLCFSFKAGNGAAHGFVLKTYSDIYSIIYIE